MNKIQLTARHASEFATTKSVVVVAAVLVLGFSSACEDRAEAASDTKDVAIEVRTGHAPLDDLDMYYEIHGAGGKPLVLLHGAYMNTTTAFGAMFAELAKNRQVIAADMQGHGRTADLARDITYEQMADDTAALLKYLKISNADVFGYSMGGGVALQLSLRHPEVVNKLILASTAYSLDGWHPEILASIAAITPEALVDTPWAKEYAKVAPRPEDWAILVSKLKKLDSTPFAWSPEDIKALQEPTMVMAGDADAIRPEHSLELFKLRGGGVPGELAGVPNSWLTILPGTNHTGVTERPELPTLITTFLDAPLNDI